MTKQRLINALVQRGVHSVFPAQMFIQQLHLLAAILSLGILLTACSDPEMPPLPDEYASWKSYRLHDYTMDQKRSCYCLESGETMRVTVRADTISLVTRMSDSTILESSCWSLYLTVESLFAIIRSPNGDSLLVSYDSQYSYPSILDINPQLHPVDGGVLYETRIIRVP